MAKLYFVESNVGLEKNSGKRLTDTLACITGSIAEAYYGIPRDIYNKAFDYLTPELQKVVKEFKEKYGKKVI